MQQDAYDFFYEIFLGTGIAGYFGPLALVVIGYFIFNKDKILGVLWFIVECLFMAQYFTLVEATPDYWWQILILMFGGLFTCVFPLIGRK